MPMTVMNWVCGGIYPRNQRLVMTMGASWQSAPLHNELVMLVLYIGYIRVHSPHRSTSKLQRTSSTSTKILSATRGKKLKFAIKMKYGDRPVE